MMRAVGGTVPSCIRAMRTRTAQLVAQMIDRTGIVYLRNHAPRNGSALRPERVLPDRGSKVVHRSDHDVATVVAAGITVQEAIRAHQKLATEGIAVRIIDAYSIKPIDRPRSAKRSGRPE